MSLRTLARASAIYTLGNIAPKIGAFVLLPIYVRFLTKSEYGSVSLLASIASVLGLVMVLGLDSALMRLHFDYQGRARSALYGTLTMFTLGVAGGLTLLLVAALGPVFPTLFAGIPFWPLGALTLLLAFTTTVQFVPSVFFRAMGQAGRFVLVNLSSFVLGSFASVALIVVVGMGAPGMLIGQLFGALVLFVVAVVIVARLGAWSFEADKAVEALRFGLPLLPHTLASWALRLSDRWLIGLLIGLPVLQAQAAIGVYSFGYQIGYVVSVIVISFNAAWSPYFFRVGQTSRGPTLFRQVTTLATAGLLVLAVGLSVLSPEVVLILAGPQYAAATQVLPVIAFASVFQGLYTLMVTVVFLMKRTARLALLTISSAILNIGLNLVLIPRIGIMGAAWSTLAGYAFFAVATWLYGRSLYPLRLDLVRLGVVSVVAVATVLLGLALSIPGNPVLQGGVHALIGLVYAAFVAVLMLRPLASLRGLTGQTSTKGQTA